jgi:YgiT-type zinc finger domain-containing protein
MNCPICKKGETAAGTATVTLERGGLTLVVKEVPAQVCDNCGEQYVNEEVAARLLAEAEAAARAGTEINVRHYQTA